MYLSSSYQHISLNDDTFHRPLQATLQDPLCYPLFEIRVGVHNSLLVDL
jgi:hypothetical protein